MSKNTLPLDIDFLKNRFIYDPTEGKSGLMYKTDILSGTRPITAGTIAGCKHKNYWVVSINKRQYKAHRIVWAINYNQDLNGYIDHINRNGFDNRLENLRIATSSENSHNRSIAKNNTSGFIGVYLDKKTNKWKASIMVEGTRKFLGSFDAPEDAFQAYLDEKSKIPQNNNLFNPGETQ